jgi:hypothetical protein
MVNNRFGQYLSHLKQCYEHRRMTSKKLMNIHQESNDYEAIFCAVTGALMDEKHLNSMDVQGRTALDLAIQYNHVTLVRWLLKKGLTKERYQQAMDQAIQTGNIRLLLLINHYARAREYESMPV